MHYINSTIISTLLSENTNNKLDFKRQLQRIPKPNSDQYLFTWF